MAGFAEKVDPSQCTLLPASLDDSVGENNPTREIDIFVDALDLNALGSQVSSPLIPAGRVTIRR